MRSQEARCRHSGARCVRAVHGLFVLVVVVLIAALAPMSSAQATTVDRLGARADSIRMEEAPDAAPSAAPDLSLGMDDGAATATPGGTIIYTLAYANGSGDPATGVVIIGTVPAHTSFDAAASSASWSCLPDNAPGSTCTVSVGALGAGASGSVSLAFDVVDPLPSGVIQVSASALIDDDHSGGADPTPANNSASDTTPVDAAPDLALAKDDGGISLTPGATVVYTLTYSNAGDQDAVGVVLSEVIPPGTVFSSTASAVGWSCVPDGNPGAACTYALGALAASGSGSVTFGVALAQTVPVGMAQIANTAQIADDGSNGSDPAPGDNSAVDTTPVIAAPDLALTKSDGAIAVGPGERITYTLGYANNGNQGAAGVVLTETVPAHTSFSASGSTAGWSCVPDATAGSLCTLALGTVAAGSSSSALFRGHRG